MYPNPDIIPQLICLPARKIKLVVWPPLGRVVQPPCLQWTPCSDASNADIRTPAYRARAALVVQKSIDTAGGQRRGVHPFAVQCYAEYILFLCCETGSPAVTPLALEVGPPLDKPSKFFSSTPVCHGFTVPNTVPSSCRAGDDAIQGRSKYCSN